MKATMARDTPESSEVEQAAGRSSLVLVFLAGAVLTIVLRGFVLSCLWGWFLTPVFGVPAPGIALCLGLCLTCAYLVPESKGKGAESPWWFLAGSFVQAGMVLLLGWIVHLCV